MDPKVENPTAITPPTEIEKESALPTPTRPCLDSWDCKPELNVETDKNVPTAENDLYFPDLENPENVPDHKPPFDAKVDGSKLQELAADINLFRNQPDKTAELYQQAGDIIRRAFANGALSELGVEFDKAYLEKQMHFSKTGKYAPSQILNFSQAMSLSKDEILKNPNLFVTAEDLKPLEAEAQVRADEMSEMISKTRTDVRAQKPAPF